MKKIILSLVIALTAMPALAQGTNSFPTAEKMADCAAMYETTSQILQQDPQYQQNADSIHNEALDWRSAGAWQLYKSKAVKEWDKALQVVSARADQTFQSYKKKITAQDQSVVAEMEKLKTSCLQMESLRTQSLTELQAKR